MAETGHQCGQRVTYRSFIDGRTAAAAIWTFDNVSSGLTDQGLYLELRTRVFRTHKGVIERGIRGEIYLRNPETGERTGSRIFTAKDDQLDPQQFARKLENLNQQEIDLEKDLISEDGELEVWVKCLEPGQYFGFAQADCYVRRPEALPMVNFWKAQLSIWVQMVIVTAIGVACSTMVNGPVAMLFTVAFVLLGFQRGDVDKKEPIPGVMFVKSNSVAEDRFTEIGGTDDKGS